MNGLIKGNKVFPTSSGVVTASVINLAPMTTAEINALSASDGWIRYSSDLPGFVGYTNGAWYPFLQNG